MRVVLMVALSSALFAASCSRRQATDGIHSTVVTLPNGAKITVEIMRQSLDLMRGMMYRDSLDTDKGMLFVHPKEGKYTYWMYNTKIPLDIIWMDRNRRVVEISDNTPPCKMESASRCPTYGGMQPALYVLELNAGAAEKNNIKIGDYLDF